MTVFDLAVVLLIANAVQNAMVGPDYSVQGDCSPPSRCSRSTERSPSSACEEDSGGA